MWLGRPSRHDHGRKTTTQQQQQLSTQSEQNLTASKLEVIIKILQCYIL